MRKKRMFLHVVCGEDSGEHCTENSSFVNFSFSQFQEKLSLCK